MRVIKTDLNSINKWLIRYCILKKFYIQVTHFFFYLTMQLVTLCLYKMYSVLYRSIKEWGDNNYGYARGGLKKMRFVLYSLYLFKKKMVLDAKKKYNKSWKKESFGHKKN